MSHISPKSTYFTIFGALMALTAVTVGAAYVDLGPLNFPVALTVALLKATLVILFFMHVKYSSTLVKLTVGGTLFFLACLFGLTMTDYLSRGMQASPKGTTGAGMLPRIAEAELPAPSAQALANPEVLWGVTCGTCHSNTTKTAPTLAEIRGLYSTDPAKIVEWAKSPGRKRKEFEQMPSFVHLGDARLQALASYMLERANSEAAPSNQ
jgi:cytochrome c oxidase subunit 4